MFIFSNYRKCFHSLLLYFYGAFYYWLNCGFFVDSSSGLRLYCVFFSGTACEVVQNLKATIDCCGFEVVTKLGYFFFFFRVNCCCPLLSHTSSRGRCLAAIWLSHRPEPSGRAVRKGSMDWTSENNMVDGLFFWATHTSRRGNHTLSLQAGAETSDTGVEAVKPDPRCFGRVIPDGSVSGMKVLSLRVVRPLRLPSVNRPDWLFFRWDILVIFLLRHFGRLSHSCIKIRRNSVH